MFPRPTPWVHVLSDYRVLLVRTSSHYFPKNELNDINSLFLVAIYRCNIITKRRLDDGLALIYAAWSTNFYIC